MTLSAWVRPTSITSDFRTVLLKEMTPGLAYSLYSNDGASRPPAGYFNSGGADQQVVATANLALNTWTHLAVTYSGTSFRIYVNGTLVTSRSITGSIRTSTGPLRIGGNSVWGELLRGNDRRSAGLQPRAHRGGDPGRHGPRRQAVVIGSRAACPHCVQRGADTLTHDHRAIDCAISNPSAAAFRMPRTIRSRSA